MVKLTVIVLFFGVYGDVLVCYLEGKKKWYLVKWKKSLLIIEKDEFSFNLKV